ncbi:ABC transporter permease subunit [Pseudoroseomonas wenyumeiae]
MAAVFSRVLRAALLEVMHRPYVQVQRSLGHGRAFVFLHSILRNALIPYVTVIGLQVRYLLGGVVVIERVFGIPGLGSLMVDAAFGRDYPVIQACALTFLVIVLLTNLLVDLLCTRLDPRARA